MKITVFEKETTRDLGGRSTRCACLGWQDIWVEMTGPTTRTPRDEGRIPLHPLAIEDSDQRQRPKLEDYNALPVAPHPAQCTDAVQLSVNGPLSVELRRPVHPAANP